MLSSHLDYLPVSSGLYIALMGALLVLGVLVKIGLIRYVYTRLGITPLSAILLLLASLAGSYVNLPLAHFPDETVVVRQYVDFFGMEVVLPREVDWPGTIIAINIGGAVIPILLSLYLLAVNKIWLPSIVATAIVSAVCYMVAEPVPGAGIMIPIFIPPLFACAAALIVAWNKAPAVAYVSGSLGTLIGADLFNLDEIRKIGTPVASIGGAGTFDGIFVTGIFAVLLASLVGAISERRATERA